MSRKPKKRKKQKRKWTEGKKKRRQAREARRKGQPRQSAVILRQKQKEAMEARRIVRELTSPFSPEMLERDLGLEEEDLLGLKLKRP